MTVARVLPDVPAVDRAFDYQCDSPLPVGTIVRVPFGGRRVRGWVLDPDAVAEGERELLSIARVVGLGPDADTIELCRWAAWRWSGRLVTMLRLASPDTVVRTLAEPSRGAERVRERGPARSELADLAASLLRSGPGTVVLRTSPSSDHVDVALAAAAAGQAIIVTPSPVEADRLTRRLRAAGQRVARWPRDWAQAAAGATVVGTRGAVFAPAPGLAALVVLDEHDERLQSEASPTWNAREVAVERGRRAAVPCVLASPCPSLEAYRAQAGLDLLGPQVAVDTLLRPALVLAQSEIRHGWAPTVVIDRRGEDIGRTGLFSPDLVTAMRRALEEDRRVICVLNRTGRARLLACRSCSSITRCDNCGSALYQPGAAELVCGHCGQRRPPVCAECGSTALARLRPGVSRAREELAALLRQPVAEVTAASGPPGDGARVVIGTTAVLEHSSPGGLVVFLDFDQQLLGARYRAAEDALALLVRASRQVGGRAAGGSVVLQTRLPDHEVIAAAVRCDPTLLSRTELVRRRLLRLPPFATVAVVGGEAGPEFMARLGQPAHVDVSDSGEGSWLLRSTAPGRMQDVLAQVVRPSGRLRLQVDPHDLGR